MVMVLEGGKGMVTQHSVLFFEVGRSTNLLDTLQLTQKKKKAQWFRVLLGDSKKIS